jgi:hypothetical protein
MTTMDTAPARQPAPTTTTAEEALTEVRKRLVQIRASVAESLSTDPSVIPWVDAELVELIRYIRNAQTGR